MEDNNDINNINNPILLTQAFAQFQIDKFNSFPIRKCFYYFLEPFFQYLLSFPQPNDNIFIRDANINEINSLLSQINKQILVIENKTNFFSEFCNYQQNKKYFLPLIKALEQLDKKLKSCHTNYSFNYQAVTYLSLFFELDSEWNKTNMANVIEDKDEFTFLFWNKYFQSVNTVNFKSLNQSLFDWIQGLNFTIDYPDYLQLFGDFVKENQDKFNFISIQTLPNFFASLFTQHNIYKKINLEFSVFRLSEDKQIMPDNFYNIGMKFIMSQNKIFINDQERDLKQENTISFGRDESKNDLCFHKTEYFIAFEQCKIFKEDNQFFLKCLGNIQPTFLRIQEKPMELLQNSIFSISLNYVFLVKNIQFIFGDQDAIHSIIQLKCLISKRQPEHQFEQHTLNTSENNSQFLFRLGRNQCNDIILPDIEVSRNHCQIFFDQKKEKWFIGERLIAEQSSYSPNGTFVSLKTINDYSMGLESEKIELEQGMNFMFDGYEFKINQIN